MDSNNDILIISGKQGSGKTTLSDEMKRIARGLGYEYFGSIKFADVLYEMHDYLLNRMEHYTGTPRVKKDGVLLQILGTEWGRYKFGADVWVNILRNRIANLKMGEWTKGAPYDGKIMTKGRRLILIDDCRFENEFDAFPEALRLRLECPADIRKLRMPEGTWRDNQQHPSEIGLDQYAADGKFDLTFNTDTQSVDHCAAMIAAQLQKRNWPDKRTAVPQGMEQAA